MRDGRSGETSETGSKLTGWRAEDRILNWGFEEGMGHEARLLRISDCGFEKAWSIGKYSWRQDDAGWRREGEPRKLYVISYMLLVFQGLLGND